MFDQIIHDFKKGHISGSEDVAIWGLRALHAKKEELDQGCSFISTYLINLKKARAVILDCAKDEVTLRNVVDYVIKIKILQKMQTLDEIKNNLERRINYIEKHIEYMPHKISIAGYRKLNKHNVIFTHGFSKTILNIFEELRQIKPNVLVTEGLPYGNGKLLTTNLKKLKIPFALFPDSGMEVAIRNSNVVLLGCRSYSKKEFVCKPGSEAIALIAKKYNKPVYICTDSLRFSEEELPELDLHPLNNGLINPLYIGVDLNLVTAVISNSGVHSVKEFLKTTKHIE